MSDNSEFYSAWSQIYDQSGWIDYNKFVEGTAWYTFKSLSTKGWDVQLAEADVAANMHALSYYPKTKPYHWLQSNSLGSSLKQRPFAVSQSRGIVLSDTAATTGFYFGIEDFMADDVPVAFKEIEQPTFEGDEFMNMNRFPIGRQTLKDVEPWLTSEPFQLKKDANYTFSESFSYGDSLKALQLLGKKGYITFSATLVDDATGQVIETLREFTIDGKQGFSRSNKPWRIKGKAFEEARVRVEITAETNLTDVQAVIENGYMDDYALGKRSEQHFEDLEFGQSEEIDTYALGQNYPNPFNPTTQITYQLLQESMVRLEVFDLLGRRVQMLVNDRQKTGRHQVTFDASSLASGVYIYRLQAGDFVQSRKLFLVK